MGKLRTFGGTAIGLVALALFFEAATAKPLNARPGVDTVVVANTAARPVPVATQGTTSVSGSVAITGGTVNVAAAGGAALAVRDVTDASATIVAQRVEAQVPQDLSGAWAPIYTVPAGMRLIVDHFSATIVGSEPDQNIVFGISGSELNALPGQSFPATVTGTSQVGYTASSPLHLLYDAGATISGNVNRSVGGGLVRPSLTVTFLLSGRLIPKV
jgi:hypothetical protein